MPPARLREPGKVRAGASAGVEWTRELQAERVPQVGFDGKGTVTKAQGIASKYRSRTWKRWLLRQSSRVAPRRINLSPRWARGFLITISGRLYVLSNTGRS